MQKKKIKIVRTHYPHWGAHSGIHRFIPFLDPEGFEIEEQIVPMGNYRFPLGRTLLSGIFRSFFKLFVRAYALNDLAAELTIIGDLRKNRYDVIHFLDADHSLLLTLFYLRMRRLFRSSPVRTQVVASFHLPLKAHKANYKIDGMLCEIDHIVALSPEEFEHFRMLSCEVKVHLIPHGIDVQFYSPGVYEESATKETEDGPFLCLTVGKWLRDYETVYETIKILEENRKIKFVIVGVPRDESRPGNLEYYNGIEDEFLRDLYRKADLLFLPLQQSTANNAILEAIACGTPVLTNRLQSVDIYVKDAGIVLDGKGTGDYAEKIRYYSANRGELRDLAKKARALAESLSWSEISARYADLYSERRP